RGCSACIARLDLSWLNVSGHVISFIARVNTMIAIPKLPPNVRAIATSTLVIGSTRLRWKRKLIWSMTLYCGGGYVSAPDNGPLASITYKIALVGETYTMLEVSPVKLAST